MNIGVSAHMFPSCELLTTYDVIMLKIMLHAT